MPFLTDTGRGSIMTARILFVALCICLLCGGFPRTAQAQDDYRVLLTDKKYSEAFALIQKKLNAIYDTRIEWKRIPTDFITAKRLEEKVNVNEEFKKRRARGFFIEENAELSGLHLDAARCLVAMEEYQSSLNHYYQSLKFKTVEYEKDDVIYHEISEIYGKLNQWRGQIDALESAYSLNPKKFGYSLELGKLYYRTADKKRAIFHLDRFVEAEPGAGSEPSLFLMLANLHQDTGKFLKAVEYYKKYLEIKPDDAQIRFGLGYLAFANTGDYSLARQSLEKALTLLPADDLYRRSKANEYLAEMAMKDLEYARAAELFLNTVKFQDEIKALLGKKDQELASFNTSLKQLRGSLMEGKKPELYPEYEMKLEELARLERDRKRIFYEYERLGAGKSRWGIATAFERLRKFDEAIRYYKEAVLFNYNPAEARDRLQKLQLKINRGY
ncbi:MAG: tetratricopeptide repeat protein [Spirochaetes bacterium]|nr:MAG: tetratricopeptide repeat protein [Spirochaetota bacterium]